MRLLLTTALATCLPVLAIAAEDDHTELGAHEHGAGAFNVAIEGKTVAMELEAPGADIVGFEHAAKSDKDKAAIKKGKSMLMDLTKVVALPAAAGCKLTAANVELRTEGEDGKHDDHDDDHDHKKKVEKHDDHDHDHDHKKKAEKHDDHDHDHDHKKKAEKHDDHDHEKHAEEEGGHSEFHAEYQLNCSNPGSLKSLTFTYFKTFKNAEKLSVSIAGDNAQKKVEANRGNATVNLAGSS